MPVEKLARAGEMEILDASPVPSNRIKGHCKACVKAGPKLEIFGWAVGVESPAKEVTVTAAGAVAGRVPVSLERADVAKRFPDLGGSATSGFRIELVPRGSGESELRVWVQLEDESREPLGRVTVLIAGGAGPFGAARAR
jgi:hypothetical protein